VERIPPRLAAALALGAGWLAFFGPFLAADGAPFYRDQLLTALPVRQYLTERLSRGQLPQWYPYEALGVAFIGQMQTATFHPFSWLLLPFAPITALKLQTALAFLLALCGAYRAARALGVSRAGSVAGALAFGYGGYAFGVSHNPSYLVAHATLPWVLWAALRVALPDRLAPRRVAALALAWALVFLAGDAQAFLVAPLVLLAVLALAKERKRAAIVCAGAGALAVLLCGAELLPAIALSGSSIRVQGRSDPLLGRFFSFHPFRLFELAAPSLIPDGLRVPVTTALFHSGGALWSTTVFAGSVVLLLAGLGLARAPRRGLPFAALAALALLLAMGAHAGLLPLLWKVARPLSWFRFPEKYAAFAWVGLFPLAALGFDGAQERPRSAARAAAIAALVALLASALLPALVRRLLGEAGAEAAEETARAWRTGCLWSAGFLGAAALALRLPGSALLLPALVCAELLHGNGAHLPLAPRAILEAPLPFAEAIRAEPHRVVSLAGGHALRTVTGEDVHWAEVMRASLRPDASGVEHVGSLSFNLPLTQVRAWRALGPNASLRGQAGPLFDGCYALVDLAAPDPTGAILLIEDRASELRLLRAPCRPRAYLSAMEPATEHDSPERLHRGLAAGASLWEHTPGAAAAAGSVRLTVDEPERLAFEVEAAADTALVVSDQLAPGWTATLDGAPAPMYFANVAARGLAVPAGRHRVEMRYRTPRLSAGAALSLLGLAAIAALALQRRDRVA
jgi:hypothetical protein